MKSAPKGVRLHIGIFGRRNVGKSSLLNAFVNQTVSIVADYPGTTTDPVNKPMELLPLGPVLFIDTAGVDDTGEVGKLRQKKTKRIFDKTDLALIVTDCEWTEWEEELCKEFKKRAVPIIAVFNKIDVNKVNETVVEKAQKCVDRVVFASALKREGIEELKQVIIDVAPKDLLEHTIIGDLVPAGSFAILVVPIDKEAPKGRLILPQVQTIRDLLDNDAAAFVVKERELAWALTLFKEKPAIVVTDSQAFLKVAADVPEDIPMTSFSILFARFKGDLDEFVRGCLTIENLKDGDKVLIAEACTHHPIADDIGTVKIPRWLVQYTGKKIEFEFARGLDFPENLSEYALVIHCGGCMYNRKQILNRIRKCKEAGVPITNYGLTIAYCLGIFERALKPFASAYEVYMELREG